MVPLWFMLLKKTDFPRSLCSLTYVKIWAVCCSNCSLNNKLSPYHIICVAFIHCSCLSRLFLRPFLIYLSIWYSQWRLGGARWYGTAGSQRVSGSQPRVCVDSRTSGSSWGGRQKPERWRKVWLPSSWAAVAAAVCRMRPPPRPEYATAGTSLEPASAKDWRRWWRLCSPLFWRWSCALCRGSRAKAQWPESGI